MIQIKNVLYFGRDEKSYKEFLIRGANTPGYEWSERLGRDVFGGDSLDVFVHPVYAVEEAVKSLQEGYYNLLVLDVRVGPGHGPDAVEMAWELLRILDLEEDMEKRYPFNRIFILAGHRDLNRLGEVVFQAGRLRVGACLVDSAGLDGWGPSAGDQDVVVALLERIAEFFLNRRKGKKALCLAGGGITGIYFEAGVLQCLEDCLENFSVTDFDMFFGISAGAMMAGLLANGYTLNEIRPSRKRGKAVMGGAGLDIWALRNLNVGPFMEKAAYKLTIFYRYIKRLMAFKESIYWAPFFSHLQDLITPLLNTQAVENILRDIFNEPGHNDDFRVIREQHNKELYIGATNQDNRRHILFGESGHDDIPISSAIAASIAFYPVFDSLRIGRDYYEDGGFTRTSNVGKAIEKKAELIFLIDPFFPYVPPNPGFARMKGIIFNSYQDIKTAGFSRYYQVSQHLFKKHPEVIHYSFFPSNDLCLLMNKNPFDYRPVEQTFKGGYLSTLSRLEERQAKMTSELAAFGIMMNLDRGREIKDRLSMGYKGSFFKLLKDADK
ncbi:MAG: patatin-like phospholipase family protein [Deltaproteobacteria bacterium]|nr:patatin-like phospholipase family protein [Deltaproteobacteria bacterium]